MGTLLVLIGGLIGAGSSFKKTFTSSWISLINLSFSVYISIFLAPLAVSLLEIPGLGAGYKNAIAIGGIFLVVNFLLQRITEQIIPNPEINFNLPSAAKFCSIVAGFFSGLIIAGILLYCFMQTPFVSGLSQKKELRATARNTLMGVVHTLNGFSFQSLSPEAEKELQSIRLIPKKKTAAPANAGQQGKEEQKAQPNANAGQQGKADQNAQSKPEANEPAEGSVKKDSAASPAKTQEKPAENKKTDDDDDDY